MRSGAVIFGIAAFVVGGFIAADGAFNIGFFESLAEEFEKDTYPLKEFIRHALGISVADFRYEAAEAKVRLYDGVMIGAAGTGALLWGVSRR